jgi:hypothetical protein
MLRWRYEQQQALSRLIKLVTRRRAGTVEVTDAALLERLREIIDYTEPGFAQLCDEIHSLLDDGFVWNSRYREWRWRQTSVRGRPRQPGFMSAWQMARLALIGPLGREPHLIEIADQLRRDATLRQHGGVERGTKVRSLLRRHQRELARLARNNVAPVLR